MIVVTFGLFKSISGSNRSRISFVVVVVVGGGGGCANISEEAEVLAANGDDDIVAAFEVVGFTDVVVVVVLSFSLSSIRTHTYGLTRTISFTNSFPFCSLFSNIFEKINK